MPHFAYQAQCQQGSAISGVIEADSFEAAMERLSQMQLQAIELTETKPPPSHRAIGADDFIFFNEQLASMASAGVCLDDGLRQLAADIGSPKLRRAVEAVAEDVRGGVPLEQAVANREGQFPPMYSRAVKAGVATGQLPATLVNLSQHLRLMAQAKRIIVESLAYPLAALLFAVVIVSVVMVVVVPMFKEIFLDFDTSLPGLTLLLIDTADVFPQLMVIAGVAGLLLLGAWLSMRASPGGRRVRESVAVSLPLIGPVVRASLISRFARSLALTVSSGVPLPESLRLAAGATGSAVLDRDAELLASQVEQGKPLGQANEKTRMIPPMFGFVSDIAAGRNSLPESMFQLAKAFDLKAAHSQSMLRAYLVPLAIIVVGVLIGGCILALFLPLISLVNSVSC